MPKQSPTQREDREQNLLDAARQAHQTMSQEKLLEEESQGA